MQNERSGNKRQADALSEADAIQRAAIVIRAWEHSDDSQALDAAREIFTIFQRTVA